MKNLIFLFLLISGLFQAQSKQEIALLKVDKTFAELSKMSGPKVAFDKFLAEKTEFVSANKPPMTDRSQIINYFGFAKFLYWIPQKAVVSKSNDLGYTYGISKMIYHNGTQDTTEYYQYISVWKKNKKVNGK